MAVQIILSRTWRRLWGPRSSKDDVHPGNDGRADLRQALPRDFSVTRYLDFNPDLAGLAGSPSRVEEHYLQFGQAEGRAYKLDEDRFGQLPADFEAEVYVDLNPDLESLCGGAAVAQAHYLMSGRQEGRSYRTADVVPSDSRPSMMDREPPADWRDLFKPGDFRALHPDLAEGAATAGSLLAAFEARGIDAVAALSIDRRFDPDFFAHCFPETASMTPAVRYRDWLENGIPVGRPGNEEEALRNLLGSPTFPDGFDWPRYAARLGPSARGWPRIRVLEHLVVTGLARGDEIPLAVSGAAPFLLAVSDVHHRMAHRCIEAGRRREAEHHERQALERGKDSVWVYTKLAELAAQRGDVGEGYALLERSRRRFEGLAPWRQALRNVVEADFAATTAGAWALYRFGERVEADAQMTQGLSRVADRLRAYEDLPGHVGSTDGGHVVLFANHSLPQCRHYRIEQRVRQLDRLKIPHRTFSSDEVEAAREALVGARTLIVYREPAFVGTIRLLLHAQAMGVPSIYDIDDLIFDTTCYPESFSTFEKQIDFESYVGLLYGTPLLRFAITLCDAGLTSTTVLARHVAPLTRTGRCDVVPNGLDDRNDRFLQAPILRADDGEVVIFYGSGSRAHNRNFNETVGPALLDLMATHSEVVLVIAGYLDLDPAFALYANRIRSFPFSSNLETYWALLSEVDINLAVLTSGEMNDGKSEIKWLEAAVSGVPSIVSASARYREVVEDGIDGLVAASPQAWRDGLLRLVRDGALRRRLGERARKRARVDYALSVTADRLAAALAPSAARQAAGRSRLRVLVVHVLFPPQSSGGATRVVRDNVDDMLDHYSDEVELAVYTTDFDAPVPSGVEGAPQPERSSRVGHYRSIPVFRVSRGSDTEFTYRDEVAAQGFAAVLASWKPDVVHFHCIQFLTGSIVEACRSAGIPYLVTLHDAWWISSSQFLIDANNLLQAPGMRALADDATTMAEVDRKRFLSDQLAGAVALLAVSDSFAEVYRRAGFPQTRSVPNGLSSLFLDVPAVRPPREGRRVRIGHIGGLPQHKGSHLLRLALEGERFGHLEAVMVDHAMNPDVRQEILWGTTPVTVRGPAEQDGVLALYADLDVLVAPSIWPESYGLVSREALALGLWVVVSDLGALGEDVVEGENGFRIDVHDAMDLARVLRLIDADPDRFRAPPKRRSQPRLASAQADDLVVIYREIVASQPTPGQGSRPTGP